MKLKRFVFFLLLLLAPIASVLPANAQVDVFQGACPTNSNGSWTYNGTTVSEDRVPSVCKDAAATGDTNVIYGKDGILTRVVSVLSLAVGFIAIVVIIIAGIKMTISQGDPAKIATTRSQIIYALVGLVVAVVAQGVVQLVLNRIGVS
jgi:hypothetical protein